MRNQLIQLALQGERTPLDCSNTLLVRAVYFNMKGNPLYMILFHVCHPLSASYRHSHNLTESYETEIDIIRPSTLQSDRHQYPSRTNRTPICVPSHKCVPSLSRRRNEEQPHKRSIPSICHTPGLQSSLLTGHFRLHRRIGCASACSVARLIALRAIVTWSRQWWHSL